MSAVAKININGLSVLNINKETLCANICPLFVLIHQLKIPHKRSSAIKPDKNETNGFCGMSAEIINATIAMLHHGKYKPDRKLKSKMRIVVSNRFIIL